MWLASPRLTPLAGYFFLQEWRIFSCLSAATCVRAAMAMVRARLSPAPRHPNLESGLHALSWIDHNQLAEHLRTHLHSLRLAPPATAGVLVLQDWPRSTLAPSTKTGGRRMMCRSLPVQAYWAHIGPAYTPAASHRLPLFEETLAWPPCRMGFACRHPSIGGGRVGRMVIMKLKKMKRIIDRV
jgi:hypothetical protein